MEALTVTATLSLCVELLAHFAKEWGQTERLLTIFEPFRWFWLETRTSRLSGFARNHHAAIHGRALRTLHQNGAGNLHREVTAKLRVEMLRKLEVILMYHAMCFVSEGLLVLDIWRSRG